MSEWHDVGHMGAMWLWWILIGVFIVVTVWAISKTVSRQNGAAGESPEDRLKRRYAEGEIDKDEYESRLKDLRR